MVELTASTGCFNNQLSREEGMVISTGNADHSLGPLDTWSPVGYALWRDLGGVALLEEMCPGDELGESKVSWYFQFFICLVLLIKG